MALTLLLQAWQQLASANAIPLGHWQLVTDIAVGEWGRGEAGSRERRLAAAACKGLLRPPSAVRRPLPTRRGGRSALLQLPAPPAVTSSPHMKLLNPVSTSSVCRRDAGRLEDKSSLVRKEALRLLQALMINNPFGPRWVLPRRVEGCAAHSQHHSGGGRLVYVDVGLWPTHTHTCSLRAASVGRLCSSCLSRCLRRPPAGCAVRCPG